MGKVVKVKDYEKSLADKLKTVVHTAPVEKLRGEVERYRGMYPVLARAPTAWLLGYIREESNGQLGTFTHLNERGYFQVMGSTATDLGWSDELFKSLSTSHEASMRYGMHAVAVAANVVARAYALSNLRDPIAEVPGYWAFVKVYHGLPLILRVMTVDFKKRNGRLPASWAEAREFALAVSLEGDGSPLDLRKFPKGLDWRIATPGIVENAEYTIHYVDEIGKKGTIKPSGRHISDDEVRRILNALAAVEPIDRGETEAELRRLVDALSTI